MKPLYPLTAILLSIGAILKAQPSAASKLDPQHEALAGLVGQWSVRQSFWSMPGRLPKIDQGSADFSMVLKRQHLRQVLRIADGTGFEGLGYMGYDNNSGQFFSTWMDVNFPGLVVARGAFDPRSRSYVLHGNMSGSEPGTSIPVREVMTMIDRNHFTYEYYETRRGSESLAVKLEYSR
jgi:hypothetical protein